MYRGARGANGQKEVYRGLFARRRRGVPVVVRGPDPPSPVPRSARHRALRQFEDFPVLPRTRQPTRSYLGVRQRRWGTWVAEITDRETHTRRWLGSFHTAELAAMEYDRWQVRYHGAAARLNFPFGTRPVHLVPLELGV